MAIIAYLMLADSPTATRSAIAGLLWSEKTEAAARGALRQCIRQLKAHLKQHKLNFLHVSQDRITLDRDNISSDLRAAYDAAQFDQAAITAIEKGQLLYGLEDLDPAFMEWLWEMRHATRVAVCARLTQKLEDARSEQERLQSARALHQLEPSLELAARPIIEHHISTGNIIELLRVYKNLWEAIDAEWEEEPSRALQELVGQARVRLGHQLPQSDGLPKSLLERQKFLCILTINVHCDVILPCPQYDRFRKHVLAEAAALLARRADQIIVVDGIDLCALFGLPSAAEQNARDAIEAALDVTEMFHASEQAFDLGGINAQLSVGLDNGMLQIATLAGEGEQPSYSGPALQRAAALSRQTGATAIYASLSTVRGHLNHYVTLREADHLGELQSVRIIGRAVAGLPALPDAQSQRQFIGRAPFFAALWSAWEEAKTGHLQIISLQGPGGVGKSRLAREFLYELSDDAVRTVAIRCERRDRSAPLEPLFEVADQLGVTFEIKERTREQLCARLATEIARRATVVFFDDWQWADDATRKVLQELADVLRDQPVLFVIAARDLSLEDGLVRASHQIHLPPMNAREVTRKAEQILQRPLDAKLSKEVYAKSGGNPLFLEEICHVIGREAQATEGQDMGTLFAANLQSLIAARIEELDDEDVRLIFAAAVHGEELDVDLLGKVLGYVVPPEALERLCGLDILSRGSPEATLRFKHGITRDVTYSMIHSDQRKALHQSYLAALQQTPEVGLQTSNPANTLEQLALHARESDAFDRAANYAERAGDRALAASSLDLAKRQFEVAMDMLDLMPQTSANKRKWLSLVIKWSKPCVYTASHDYVVVLERAAQIAHGIGDNVATATVSYWMGYFLLVLGEYEKADHHLSLAEVQAKQLGIEPLIFEAKAIRACTLEAKGDAAQAKAMFAVAMEAKARNPVQTGHPPVTSAYIRAVLGVMEADQGDFDASEQLFCDALARIEGFDHEIESSILSLAGAVQIWRGDWQKSREFALLARERAERVSAPYLIGMSRCIHGYVSWRITGNPAHLEELKTMTYWLDAQGMRLYLTFAWGWLADALVEAGRTDEGIAAAERALAQARSGEGKGAAMACRALARAAMTPGGGGIEAAQAHLATAHSWADARNSVHESAHTTLTEASILLQTGDLAGGSLRLDQVQATFEQLSMKWHLSQAQDLSAKYHPDPEDVVIR